MNMFAERIAAGNYSALWVCQCCMLVEANGECCADDKHGGDGCEPLSLIPDTADISLGMLAEDHAEDCLQHTLGWENIPDDYECECEQRGFSWSSCEGCGSNLGGNRHALFVVYDMR